MLRRVLNIKCLFLTFVLVNFLFFIFIFSFPELEQHGKQYQCPKNPEDPTTVEKENQQLAFENENLKNQVKRLEKELKAYLGSSIEFVKENIGVILITYDRYEYLDRCLGQIVPLLPNSTKMLISQDLPTSDTITSNSGTLTPHEKSEKIRSVISKYMKDHQNIIHVERKNRQRPSNDIKLRPSDPEVYYYISSHFGFAFSYAFDTLGWNAAIVLEDDMEISADFFDYFLAGYRLMQQDPSIFTISAWNDNGSPHLISLDPQKLWRSDFFSGLGWLMTQSLWKEFRDGWPVAFWDDWIREPEQHRGRSTIRPEISRSHNFGAQGSSGGQFFEKISSVVFNQDFIPWSQKNLSFFHKESYDKWFMDWIEEGSHINNPSEIQGANQSFILTYQSIDHFSNLLKHFGLMSDFKAGVARTGYYGVVSFTNPSHNVIKIVPANKDLINNRLIGFPNSSPVNSKFSKIIK